MIKYFECPDKQICEIKDCLEKCRMGFRCLSIPTLRLIAEQRVWTGKPSTTQLLKGTREAYLEIISNDLIEDPKDQLFRILGTKGHGILEQYTVNELAEIRLQDENTTGAFDLYDPENQTLYDYKTWGSYKVVKALGIEMVDVETDEVYKIGAKKGQKKTKKEIRYGVPDMRDTELQINNYRLLLEAAGHPVQQMYVEAIVRDGGTFYANNRGITENGYLIPVKRLPDDEVREFFAAKNNALLQALETKTIPPICSLEERWEDRKCKDYCTVACHCDHGILVRGEAK